MKFDQLRQFCTLFYASHYIPVFLYRQGERPEFSCSAAAGWSPSYHIRENLAGEENPACFSSSEAGMWGRIRVPSCGCTVMFGPVFSGDVTSEMLHAFLSWHGLSADRISEVSDCLRGIPKYSYYHFLNLLAFLHFILNGEVADVADRYDRQRGQYGERISAAQTRESVSAMEDIRRHGTYALEQRLLDFIRAGDVGHLQDYLTGTVQTSRLQEGKLAENPLRQAKNIFIGAATMFGKVGAIGGGLDVEESYQLIDAYIQECERQSSIDAVVALQYSMLMDFTARVAESKIPEGISGDIYAAVQFIGNHANEAIGIDEVAAHIGKSRSYLTAKFKKETGQTVNKYILHKKLDEAKNLLKHTDKSLSEIACFLCFSSQAYFQNVFKKTFGVSPAKYRRRCQGV